MEPFFLKEVLAMVWLKTKKLGHKQFVQATVDKDKFVRETVEKKKLLRLLELRKNTHTQ